MGLDYELEIRGPLPLGVCDELRRRFGDVTVRSDGDRTVVGNLTADQAALRALLGLIWDVGGELRALRVVGRRERGGRR